MVFQSYITWHFRICHRNSAAPAPQPRFPRAADHGDAAAPSEERLIGGDTGLAAVMARARMVSRQRRAGAAVRRNRHGQGDRRPRHPRALRLPERAVPPRELRRDCPGADRLGAVRPRAGRVHRRRQPAARAGSSRPTAARCSWTRSASWRPRPRCACCAWCRTARSCASAASGRSA